MDLPGGDLLQMGVKVSVLLNLSDFVMQPECRAVSWVASKQWC